MKTRQAFFAFLLAFLIISLTLVEESFSELNSAFMSVQPPFHKYPRTSLRCPVSRGDLSESEIIFFSGLRAGRGMSPGRDSINHTFFDQLYVDGVPYNIEKLYNNYHACKNGGNTSAGRRGEYETKAEYEKRIGTRGGSCEALSNLKNIYNYVPVVLKYNADTEEFTLEIFRFIHLGEDQHSYSYNVLRMSQNIGVVKSYSSDWIDAVQSSKSFFKSVQGRYGSYNGSSFEVKAKSPVDRARALKTIEQSLKYKISGQGNIGCGDDRYRFDYLVEKIELINTETGEVLFVFR